MRKLLITILFIVLCTGCTITENSRNFDESMNAEIDWMDVIMINDIKYMGNRHISSDESTDVNMGELYGTVEFKVADVVRDPSYQIINGDSTFNNIGSEIYEMTGYKPEFRLAVMRDSSVVIYEVYDNPDAVIGEDILDIKEKVEYISLNSEVDGRTQVGTLRDEESMNKIIDSILISKIDNDLERNYEGRYFIELHLKDGTSVVRNFLPNSNIIGDGIVIDNRIKEELLKCVE